jgi:predicted dithiol-disulfide oxidoreductase (DUF899 family)
MFGADYKAGCPNCSSIADGFNGNVVHLENHDVSFYAISQAPLEKLQAYKHRLGCPLPKSRVPWSLGQGSFSLPAQHFQPHWQMHQA